MVSFYFTQQLTMQPLPPKRNLALEDFYFMLVRLARFTKNRFESQMGYNLGIYKHQFSHM